MKTFHENFVVKEVLLLYLKRCGLTVLMYVTYTLFFTYTSGLVPITGKKILTIATIDFSVCLVLDSFAKYIVSLSPVSKIRIILI